MKKFAQNLSFLKTLSVYIIFSSFGINIQGCKASDPREEVTEEQGKKRAVVNTAEEIVIPAELLDPELENQWNKYWAEVNARYKETNNAGYFFREQKPFDEQVAETAKKALPLLTGHFKQIKAANKTLLKWRKDSISEIRDLKSERIKLKTRISELEKQLEESRRSTTTEISMQPERMTALEAEIQQLKLHNTELTTRFSQLETVTQSPSKKSPMVVEENSELEAENKRLKEENAQLQARLQQPPEAEQEIEQDIIIQTPVINVSPISFWKPWTWYYLFFSRVSGETSKV